MRSPLALTALTLALTSSGLNAAETRLFEMRVYTAAEGKLEALHKRFRDHTLKLFEKHGITNIGYWVPVDNKENKLYFVLAYKDREAREASWKAFLADEAWKKAYAESEKDGKLVVKTDQYFMTATDYSPELKVGQAEKERVFELRLYTATEGNLEALNNRFKNHTMKLFQKHGMTNVIYWNLAKGEKDEKSKLIYMLSHESVEAAKKSFDSFRMDPDWIAARSESEKKAGGSLTAAKGGVISQFLKATDYSPTK